MFITHSRVKLNNLSYLSSTCSALKHMDVFHWNVILYLSFHAIGGLFCLISALGIPGQLDESNTKIKYLSLLLNILMNLAWTGIPLLLIGSIIAFYFHQSATGIILSSTSLGLGLSLFLCLVVLYKVK